ncbi:MAG: hypothetical protein GWN99_20615, partial [Gemmatimonadetes bacterium]|nr:hypothetical protein [Gemmatimonadota bacterium]NIS03427.1 hypothetical protein [Gemmatimonadota bacterium]NIT68801.1 hypothetical protein [Gemmatimonadota bacterium]NIU54767.1 hypothetical protein [Gemmatimonadota bacterium]NIV25764.1 hypothetical protein [Gemmatimonadota bacterium]
LRLVLVAWPLLVPVRLAASSPVSATPQTGDALAQIDTTYGCVICHADKRRAFLQGTHSERGIRCHDCHGGDPRAVEQPAA